MNDSVSNVLKKDILRYITLEINDTVIDYNNFLNPSRNILTKPLRPEIFDSFSQLELLNSDIKNNCYNPHWESKDLATIICKQNGKFYCLNVFDLINQISVDGTAKNPYTGVELNGEIITNLRNKYLIKSITETNVSRTKMELDRLTKSRDILTEFLRDYDE